MRQKRSIRRNIELPVAIHEVLDGSAFWLLKVVFMFDTKTQFKGKALGTSLLSQGKDNFGKVILIRFTFQECFLVSFFSGFSMIISFSSHISIHCFNSLFPLIFPIYLNKN